MGNCVLEAQVRSRGQEARQRVEMAWAHRRGWRELLGLGFALVALVAVSGCSGALQSPSAVSSQAPSASSTPTGAPTPTASPTPSPSPTPVPTPTPVPAFVSTGKMHAARLDAAAVRLKDGRVLIAGGSPNQGMENPVLGSAELYDPSTGKFTLTGSLKTARSAATAVLLADGRVLVIGGYGCPPKSAPCTPGDTVSGGDALSSAELYDPSTGTFTPTGSMATPRQYANAMLMADGRVLVVGWSTLVEVYDPATGKFTKAGSLAAQYDEWTATLLANGKVLVTGESYYIASELFDPVTGQSTLISMANVPDLHKMSGPTTTTLLNDGRVLVAINGYLLTYDPATNSFEESGSNSKPGSWFDATATLLSDGEVLFAGGALDSKDHSSESETDSAGIYDPATGFHMIHSIIGARADHTAILLLDGSVLIAGGDNGLPGLSSAELFVP